MNKFEDPSLEDDFAEIYQVEKLFKLCNKLKSFDDTFMARIFKSPSCYKIQLTSQNNVSFLYKCLIDYNRCVQISTQNSIDIGYSNLFEWLKHIFNDDLTYEFHLVGKLTAELKVYKNEKFKLYELASIPFQLATEDEVRQNVMYRYQRMKNRKQLLIDYWNKMTIILKTKNPSLLINFQNERKAKKAFK